MSEIDRMLSQKGKIMLSIYSVRQPVYVAELSRVIGASPSVTSRLLQELEKEGMEKETRVGKKKYYSPSKKGDEDVQDFLSKVSNPKEVIEYYRTARKKALV